MERRVKRMDRADGEKMDREEERIMIRRRRIGGRENTTSDEERKDRVVH